MEKIIKVYKENKLIDPKYFAYLEDNSGNSLSKIRGSGDSFQGAIGNLVYNHENELGIKIFNGGLE